MPRKTRKPKEESTMSDETNETTAVETPETPEVEATGEVDAATEKRARKLEKDLVKNPGKVTITVVGGTEGEMIFDPAELPADIQTKLVPFGLGHKLGDAAAGRSGTEAEDAIKKVWDGLMKADWTVRAPAAPKVSLKDIADNLKNLSPEEAAAAKVLLKTMGINLPGITD